MKKSFFEYYPPTPQQYDQLWKEGIIIPDANVLLNLYRLPATARQELIQVLEAVKDRLWVPHQVALEFQRNRLTVISGERKAAETVLSSAQDLVADLKKKVEALQMDKHGLDVQPAPLLDDLEKANAKLIEAISAVHETRPDIAASDAIRETLDSILSDRVGPGPTNQADLDAVADGEQRYADRIPPGYADADKEKNPNLAIFFHDQIKYQRKFGDLILWKQLISYVKEKEIKSVLLVTADLKEDWWWREQGKTIGVQPELVREIRKFGGVELFWMYSSVQFLEYAKTHTKADVSEQAIAELQEVSKNPRPLFTTWDTIKNWRSESFKNHTWTNIGGLSSQVDYHDIESAVQEWLSEEYGEVIQTAGFPDFVVPHEADLHGYEVKYLRNFDKMLFTPPAINSMLRGYLEVREGRLSDFTMIAVISDEDASMIREGSKINTLRGRLDQLLARYPIGGIVVGTVADAQFEPLIHQRGH